MFQVLSAVGPHTLQVRNRGKRHLGIAALFLLVSCAHGASVEPEQEAVALTIAATDETLVSAMNATAAGFGATGSGSLADRSWRSGIMHIGAVGPTGATLRGMPPGLVVITAQIADTAAGMRRVLFHATIANETALTHQQRLELTHFSLLNFVAQLRRHLAGLP